MRQKQKPRRPKPVPPAYEAETEQSQPLLCTLIYNIIAVVILTAIFSLLGLPYIANIFANLMPCMSPFPRALGSAIILLLSLHFLYSLLVLSKKEGLTALEGNVKLIVTLFKYLQPPELARPGLWGSILLIFCVIFAAIYLGGVFSIRVPMPHIDGFNVTYPRDETNEYKGGQTIHLVAGQLVQVEAVITNTVDPQCNWSALSGTLFPSEGCATQYSMQTVDAQDILTLHVQTQCRTQNAYKSLNVETAP